MLKIAHRGNTNGPSSGENSPARILEALSKGFDVEVDTWVLDGDVYFGHDDPVYGPIEESFLSEIGAHAWIHCKNLQALHFFASNYPKFRYFWHQEDDYTLTSNGYIWTYPGQQTTDRSIIVALGPHKPTGTYYGICSDYVEEL